MIIRTRNRRNACNNNLRWYYTALLNMDLCPIPHTYSENFYSLEAKTTNRMHILLRTEEHVHHWTRGLWYRTLLKRKTRRVKELQMGAARNVDRSEGLGRDSQRDRRQKQEPREKVSRKLGEREKWEKKRKIPLRMR